MRVSAVVSWSIFHEPFYKPYVKKKKTNYIDYTYSMIHLFPFLDYFEPSATPVHLVTGVQK